MMRRTRKQPLFLAIFFVVALIVSCGRGGFKEKPPIHLNPNMDSQDKFKAQSENPFFIDGASMRTPVEGTVARGELRADDAYFRGKDASGNFVAKAPMQFTSDMIERGKERYDIYCVACHGANADGKGKIMDYKYPIPPANFYDERIMKLSDGHMYNAISEGWLNMPSLKAQISVDDRWAIIAYIRSIQMQ
jgi:mono/diheme cytochrome c family protein